jgi:hypothetical protein
MNNAYLNRPVSVKLITGETLPDGILFWGESTISQGLLWFGIPKEGEVHKTEVEFHIPVSSVAYIRIYGGEI